MLPKVKAYHESLGVPFGHWQFDYWFYPKDGGVNPGGGGGAVTNWTALPDVFPSGMAGIQQAGAHLEPRLVLGSCLLSRRHLVAYAT